MGSKYTLEIDVIGDASKELAEIAAGLGSIQKQAGFLGDVFGELNKSTQQLTSTNSIANMQNLSRALGEQADKFIGFSENIIGASRDLVSSIVKDASEFEDSASAMKFAFGDDWQNMLAKTKQEATKLSFTFKQTVDLASALGRLKINPFGTEGDKLEIFKSKTGEMISALEVLQDAADASGRNAEALLFSVREAVSGDWKSLRDALDLPKKMTEDWKKEMDKVNTQQEKYNILVARMAEFVGGAGRTRAENLSKAMAQLPDLAQILRANVGAEGMKEISKGLWEFVGALSKFANDADVIAALGSAFKLVGEALAYGLRMAAGFVTQLKEVLKAAPWLPKLAMAIMLIVTALSAAIGLTLSLAAGFLAVYSAINLVGAQAVATFIVYFLPALLAVSAVIGLIGLLIKAAGANMDRAFGNSTVSTLEKIKLTFEALGELFASYDGTSSNMSEGMAGKLKQAGIFEFVTDLFKIYHRIHSFFSAFSKTIGEIGDKLAPKIVPMLEELKAAFFEFLNALGLLSGKQKAAGSDTQSWVDAGKGLAELIIKIVGYIADFIRFAAYLSRVAMEFGALKVVASLAAIYIGILAVKAVAAGASMAAAFIAANAPLLLMLASVLLLVNAIKELQAQWDDNSSSQIWSKFKNDIGVTSDEEYAAEMDKRQGIKTGKDAMGSSPAKAATTPSPVAQAALAPSPVVGASAAAANSSAQTTDAMAGMNAKMGDLANRVAQIKPEAKVGVYLDSAEIAAQIKKDDTRIGGVG